MLSSGSGGNLRLPAVDSHSSINGRAEAGRRPRSARSGRRRRRVPRPVGVRLLRQLILQLRLWQQRRLRVLLLLLLRGGVWPGRPAVGRRGRLRRVLLRERLAGCRRPRQRRRSANYRCPGHPPRHHRSAPRVVSTTIQRSSRIQVIHISRRDLLSALRLFSQVPSSCLQS